MITLAVYEGGLAYGGPEEGGWWFWAGDLVPGTVRHADTEEEAIETATRLRATYPAGSDRTSVLPRETDYQVEWFEDTDTAPEFVPATRPFYE